MSITHILERAPASNPELLKAAIIDVVINLDARLTNLEPSNSKGDD